ncbi:MAG: helix-turn-helix domain-containing protein [Plesiomonas shigelloides]
MSAPQLKDKWKSGSMSLGWTAIPTVLFFIQNEKKLNSLAFNTLLNLLAHWWTPDEWPHPSLESLAIRMGVSVRSVQRAINDLEKANLLDKKPTKKSDKKYGGRNIYDLTKLVNYLDIMGPSIAALVKNKSYKQQERSKKERE